MQQRRVDMMYSTSYPYNGNIFQPPPSRATTQIYSPCSYPTRFPSSPSNSSFPYTAPSNRDYPPPLSHPNDPTRGFYSTPHRDDISYFRSEQGAPHNQDFIPNQANQQCRFSNNAYEAYNESCDEGTV